MVRAEKSWEFNILGVQDCSGWIFQSEANEAKSYRVNNIEYTVIKKKIGAENSHPSTSQMSCPDECLGSLYQVHNAASREIVELSIAIPRRCNACVFYQSYYRPWKCLKNQAFSRNTQLYF